MVFKLYCSSLYCGEPSRFKYPMLQINFMKEERIISKMAIYTIKKNKVKSVAGAMKELIDEVHEKEPGTITYLIFQKKNKPHEFVHFMVFKNKHAEKLHKKTKHMKRFLDIVYPNSLREPVFIDLNKVH